VTVRHTLFDCDPNLATPGRRRKGRYTQDIAHVFSNARRVASSFEAPPSAEHLKMTIMMTYSPYGRRPEVLFSLKRASKDDSTT